MSLVHVHHDKIQLVLYHAGCEKISAISPTDIGAQALVPTVVCTALATSVVSLRWYTRCKIVHTIGLDDFVILMSLLLSWTITALTAAEVSAGIGHHDFVGVVPFIPLIAKLVLASNCIYVLLVYITKASILLQYLRVFQFPAIRIISYLLLALFVPAIAWGVFGGIFLCDPVAKFWNPFLAGTCLNSQTYWLSTAATNIVLDLAVLILPMPAIAGLRLPRRQKGALLGVFLLGFFVCAISTVRLVLVHVAAERQQWTRSGIRAIIWSSVEANVGIVCASLLALKPLLERLFPRLMDDNHRIPRHSMRLPFLADDGGDAGVTPRCYAKGEDADTVFGRENNGVGRAHGKEPERYRIRVAFRRRKGAGEERERNSGGAARDAHRSGATADMDAEGLWEMAQCGWPQGEIV